MFTAQARVSRSLLSVLSLALAGCLAAAAAACHREAGSTPAAAVDTAADAAKAMNAWEGVNYDPATPAENLSMTPVKFEGTVEIEGEKADLVGDFTSWIVGVTALGPGKLASWKGCRVLGQETDRKADCDITFVRFGNFGRLDKPRNLWWAMDLDLQPGSPNGYLRAAVEKDGSLVFPATIRFELPLVLLLQEEGSQEVVRLRSRPSPVFQGTVEGWPQGLMVVSLSNGPVRFFKDEGSGIAGSRPYLVLETGTLAFADKPSEFFRNKPQIVSAQAVEGGVSLSWDATAREILSSQVSGYSIYRKQGGPETWQRIATVARDTTSYLDKTNDGRGESEYVVVHTMEFPFNRKYEGLYGSPAIVKPIAR